MKESPCKECERLLQSYLDGELNEPEALRAERHLDACGYCRRHYRLERLFRAHVRLAISEPVPPELLAKLSSLRTIPSA